MKKVLVLILTAMFFYSMFWHVNIVNVLLMILGLGLTLALYRLSERFLLSMKYPMIILQLAVTALFFIFPHLKYKHLMDAPVASIAFYSMLFYLVSLKEKERSLYKELLAISILFFSAFFNLLIVNKPALILSIGLPVILYLFIIGHNKVIPFIGGYILIISVFLFMKKIPLVGSGLFFNNDLHRYMLILAPLFLFVWSFIGFVKNTATLKVISFLIFLFIMVDIFITVGAKFSSSILYQPLTAILVFSLAAGIMMKGEKR